MKNILILLLALPVFTHAQIITTVAGNGMMGYSGDGGVATDAKLFWPSAVAVDHSGNIYITDQNRIRKVNTSGIITTVAGNGSGGYSGDGMQATNATLQAPGGITVDGHGNLYIVDGGNKRIRKVNTVGIITTFAGNGIAGDTGDGGAATAAQIDPNGIAVDNIGNIYIADCHRVRRVDTFGIITTIAGKGNGCPIGAGYSGDGGPATAAELNGSIDVAISRSGDFSGIYIADYLNKRIRFVNSAGIITTYAGGGTGGLGNGGPATAAQLTGPTGIAVDPSGNLYIVDEPNNSVRIVNTSGIITTFAGNYTAGFSGDGGPPLAAQLNHPHGIDIDDSGNVYIDDLTNGRIRKVSKLPMKVNALSAENEFTDIYPNPAKNELIVSSSSPVTDITIFNVFGQSVIELVPPQNADNKLRINIERLPEGVYFLRLNKLKVSKFVKY